MPFTNFNQHQLFYTQQGKGFPLVFIHGFCEDSLIWKDFVQPFLPFYQVITIDLPGFGQSDVQPEHRIETYREAVKTVLTTLNIQQCILIGHSMGGYTALAFAEKYPEYLQGFALFHSHPFADSDSKKANREKTINFIQKYGTAPFLGQMLPNLFSEAFQKNNKTLIDKMIEEATAYSEAGIVAGLEAMINRPDRCAVLAQSQQPILLIIGKEDTAIPYRDSLKMSDLAPITVLHILENVGHMGMFEATAITQKIIFDFLEFLDIRYYTYEVSKV